MARKARMRPSWKKTKKTRTASGSRHEKVTQRS
jgi:hypothetical protein